MKISEKYKIESDELNIIVKERYRSKKGELQWKSISYHPNLEMAYKSLIEREINGTGMKDVETVVAKIKELEEFLKEIFK